MSNPDLCIFNSGLIVLTILQTVSLLCFNGFWPLYNLKKANLLYDVLHSIYKKTIYYRMTLINYVEWNKSIKGRKTHTYKIVEGRASSRWKVLS